MLSRREKLQEMLKSDPEDTFCLYGLAMEEKSSGNFTEALRWFDQLLTIDPDHVASYLMKAQLLIDHEKSEAARSVIVSGANVARKVGDQHALGEILGLLEMIE